MKPKHIICFILAGLLSVAVCTVCSAEEKENSIPTFDETEATAETEASENYQNPFGAAFDFLTEHAAEFFSALSFLGACLVGFGYKKGMLPLLKTGLSAVVKGTESIGSETQIALEKSDEICKKVNNYLHDISTFADSVTESVRKMEATVSAMESEKESREVEKKLLIGQIEMLSEIFLSSSLPQYEKERIGEKANELKALIGGDGHAS